MKSTSKTKIIIMAVCIVVLIAASIVVIRFIQNIMFSATQQLQTMGEAPIVQKVEEEQWSAPTMDPYEIDDGIDNVTTEYQEQNPMVINSNDSDNEELESVAVEETLDELADTAYDELPDDVPVDSVIEDTPSPMDTNTVEAN